METVVLASGSKTRKLMLLAAGLSFEVLPAVVDEDEIRPPYRLRGQTQRLLLNPWRNTRRGWFPENCHRPLLLAQIKSWNVTIRI